MILNLPNAFVLMALTRIDLLISWDARQNALTHRTTQLSYFRGLIVKGEISFMCIFKWLPFYCSIRCFQLLTSTIQLARKSFPWQIYVRVYVRQQIQAQRTKDRNTLEESRQFAALCLGVYV